MNQRLKSVIRHEYLTVIKQPGFILSMLGVPLLIMAIFAIGYFAERTTETTLEEAATEVQNVQIVDKSDVIRAEHVAELGYSLSDSGADTAIDQVRAEEIEGAIIYPEDVLETREFWVYVGSDGSQIFFSSMLQDIGEQLLIGSVTAELDDENLVGLLQLGTSSDVTTFQDGEEAVGFAEQIVPGVFMAMFFVILFFTMGYMLLGVSEEKENRSMEMMLTHLRPRTLITGKLFAVTLVGLTQFVFFVLLGIAAYFAVTSLDVVTIPFDIDLSTVVFDPVAIIAGALILIFGFLLFAAVMSGVAAMMPGVKEANSLSSIFYILAFVPFWSSQVILMAPDATLVKFLSFFPLTAPTTLLFRNTIGNIDTLELSLAIATLIVFTLLSFLLATKLFRLGALEFNDRVKLTKLFAK